MFYQQQSCMTIILPLNIKFKMLGPSNTLVDPLTHNSQIEVVNSTGTRRDNIVENSMLKIWILSDSPTYFGKYFVFVKTSDNCSCRAHSILIQAIFYSNLSSLDRASINCQLFYLQQSCMTIVLLPNITFKMLCYSNTLEDPLTCNHHIEGVNSIDRQFNGENRYILK